MAKRRPPTADVVPGLPRAPARIALKGRLRIAYNSRLGVHVAQSWPRGNGGMTPARLRAIDQFKKMVSGLKYATGEQVQAAKELQHTTPFTWRDIIQMAATGRFVFITNSDGSVWIGWRMANETIQVLLDSIFNQVGCMLIRTPNGWEALLPPTSTKALVFDTTVNFPQWLDVPMDAQALLDQIGTTPGTMIINSGGTWVAVDPTTLFDAAGAAAAALATAEAYTDTKVAGAGVPFHPGFIAGRWYTIAEVGESSVFLNSNEIYTCPFYVGAAHTFQAIGIHVSGAAAAGKVAELGVYASSGAQPAALLLDAGNVAVDSTGDKIISGLSLALTPGWYFLAVASNGSPTITSLSNSGSFTASALLGRANIGDVVTGFINRSWTFSAGALPNPFGTSAYGSSGAPLILLKG